MGSGSYSCSDAWNKRGVKGCLITVSDEPIHKTLSKQAIRHYIGAVKILTYQRVTF